MCIRSKYQIWSKSKFWRTSSAFTSARGGVTPVSPWRRALRSVRHGAPCGAGVVRMGVALALWALTILWLIPEFVGPILEGRSERFRYPTVGEVFAAIAGEIDVSGQLLGFVLRGTNMGCLCVLWTSAASLVSYSRGVLIRRRGPLPRWRQLRDDDTLYPSCCVPCAATQLLAALGIRATNYRLCAELPPIPSPEIAI